MGSGNPLRITTPLRLVLDVLMEDPTAERYGLELAGQTGLSSGSLYPILARLEAVGWIIGEWEQVDAHHVGRPRRRYYRLTSSGLEKARQVLQETKPPLARRLQLGWQP